MSTLIVVIDGDCWKLLLMYLMLVLGIGYLCYIQFGLTLIGYYALSKKRRFEEVEEVHWLDGMPYQRSIIVDVHIMHYYWQ